MIRRDDGDDWLLISQLDHAHLAGEIAAVWGSKTVPPLPYSNWLVSAVRGHDDGWQQWEATPRIDLAIGKPREFLEMPMTEATAIWSRSIAACGRAPFGKLWVSRHFQHLARLALESRADNDEDIASLERFLDEQSVVESEERAAGSDLSIIGNSYDQLADLGFRFVQMFDRMSLWLCCGRRTKPQEFNVPEFDMIRFTPQRDGRTIFAEPFPLTVNRLELSTPARRIPARRYENDEQYQRELAAATVEELRWIIEAK